MPKLTFHILTLFPEMFAGPLTTSILKRAQDKGVIEVKFYNLREFGEGIHHIVDDTPCGGGPGMVARIDVMDSAITSINAKRKTQNAKLRSPDVSGRTILMTPQGRPLDQQKAEELSKLTDIILVCGHYEGFDERIREHLVDEEISLGDFVLSGGEIPAMAVIDATARLVPGVLGKEESAAEESFNLKDEAGHRLLEYPVYTRPVEYKGWTVPEVLLSGNHGEIKKWRLAAAKERTNRKRPDLLQDN